MFCFADVEGGRAGNYKTNTAHELHGNDCAVQSISDRVQLQLSSFKLCRTAKDPLQSQVLTMRWCCAHLDEVDLMVGSKHVYHHGFESKTNDSH